VLSWWQWLEARLRPDAAAPRPSLPVTVSIEARLGSWERSMTWTLPVGPHEWLRIRTGAVPVSDAVDLVRIESGGLSVTLSMHATAMGDERTPRKTARLVSPRLLTDLDLPRSSVAYAVNDGVVCVPPHATRSVLLRADGSVFTQHEWPRPVMFELPYGDGGAVAWSNGLSGWPDVAPAYVMYRRTAGGEVTTEELPFRPALGTWWRERLRFACYPAGVHAWTGLASWAPGAKASFDFRGIVAIGLHVVGDELVIEPGTIAPQGGFTPELETAGWRASTRRRLTRASRSREGPCSSQEMCGAWTASAYPHANLVRLAHVDGRSTELLCEAPFRLGWLNGDLVVSTRTRDVLRFDRVIDALEHVDWSVA
jgi:hypothetical protein